MYEEQLEVLVNRIERAVEATATDRDISDTDLRRVLAFIVKVVQVVDQAFEDVYMLLIEFTHLPAEGLEPNQLTELKERLDLLQARSHYRDAEEICSRLHHLQRQYTDHIAPAVQHLDKPERWRELLWLIQQREGGIIDLVDHAVYRLSFLLHDADEPAIPRIKRIAAEEAEKIRGSLYELKSLKNEILGLSGRVGFLELTADRDALDKSVNVYVNRPSVQMSQDIYSAGQAGAMGPGAHAHDMTFQQMWDQSQGDFDLRTLATELSQLRKAMREQATSAEQDIATGEAAAAEAAAAEGNGPAALEHLKKAGKWALDVATKIGAGVATAALKTSLGL